MSEIQLPGLATGIDTRAIIEQLMEVNSRRLKAMQADVSKETEEGTALNEMETKLESYRTAVRVLADSDDLKSFNAATSDDDFLTASATTSAHEGNHSVQIKQLATSDRWIHDGLKYPTSYVTAGKFVFSYNNEEVVIETTAETTLEDMVGLINNDPDNPGVTASILKYDAGSDQVYHLVLAGDEGGLDKQITINGSNTEVWGSDSTTLFLLNGDNAALTTKLTDLDNVTDGPLASGDDITIVGTDHYGQTVNTAISVDQYTTMADLLNEIEEAYSGTVKASFKNGQIKLTAITDGASDLTVSSFTFTGGGSGASMSLPTFALEGDQGGTIVDGDLITGFKVADFLETQSAQDSKIKVDGYPPATAISEIQTVTTDTSSTGGTYTYTYQGHTTTALAYDANVSTIQAAIDALDNVTAGDITVANTLNNDTEFTFKDTLGDVDLIVLNTENLIDGVHYLRETTQGSDGWISRSTNSVDDVVEGVTLALQDDTYNGSTYDSIEVTLTRDTAALKEKLDAMIKTYNEFVDFMKSNAEYNANTRSSGILYGNYSLTSVSSQLKSIYTLVTDGFTSDDSFFMPGDIGFEIDANNKLSLNSSDFNDAIAEDYNGVLDLVGAIGKGSSNSEVIKYYDGGANTEAGTYNVKVIISGGVITSAKIWTSDETEDDARDATIDGNTIIGDASFTDGYPDHPENSLTMTVDLTTDDTFEAIVYVKKGFAGASKDLLDDVLKTETGRIDVSQDSVRDTIERLNKRIDTEQRRLEKIENALVLKFARLEQTLSMLNQQMSGLNIG